MKPTIVNAFRGAIDEDGIAIEFGVAKDGGGRQRLQSHRPGGFTGTG